MANFQVNGQDVSCGKDVNLLEFLREELNVTSVKNGCSEGVCGACMVLVDGKATRACLQKMDKLEGKKVVTVEGLTDREKDVYTYAFASAGAVQCGFCMPGMVISAKGIVDAHPEPTHDDLAKGLATNLCRCTGYVKIEKAIVDSARIFKEGAAVPDGHDAALGVGARIQRVDAQGEGPRHGGLRGRHEGPRDAPRRRAAAPEGPDPPEGDRRLRGARDAGRQGRPDGRRRSGRPLPRAHHPRLARDDRRRRGDALRRRRHRPRRRRDPDPGEGGRGEDRPRLRRPPAARRPEAGARRGRPEAPPQGEPPREVAAEAGRPGQGDRRGGHRRPKEVPDARDRARLHGGARAPWPSPGRTGRSPSTPGPRASTTTTRGSSASSASPRRRSRSSAPTSGAASAARKT